MPDHRLRAWIRQAQADLVAGRAEGVEPCHRRYWLQQSYEKGIKALGLILWQGHANEEGQLRRHFLGRHSPLKVLSREAANDPNVPRSLRLLLRQLQTELGTLDGAGVLKRVDENEATMNPTDVSYRYPFQDAAGSHVAPADWTEANWDAYQGSAMGVVAAVTRFLGIVENRRIKSRA